MDDGDMVQTSFYNTSTIDSADDTLSLQQAKIQNIDAIMIEKGSK